MEVKNYANLVSHFFFPQHLKSHLLSPEMRMIGTFFLSPVLPFHNVDVDLKSEHD